jgi:uncharacterized protein
MKSPRHALLLLQLVFVTTIALPQTVPAQTATRRPLWKIEGPKCSVYLVGSVHFLKKEHYPLPAPIEQAFERAKIAVFETDLGSTENSEFKASLLQKSVLPEGQKLQDQLSPQLFERLEKQLMESGLPVAVVEKFKPGMVAMSIVMVELQRLNLDPQMGLDQHFYQRAKKAGKEIRALESPELQLNLITGFSKEEGEAMLDSTLKDIKTLKTELDKLLQSWQTGDMAGLAKLLNKALSEHPGLYQRLLADRNKTWLPAVEELIRGDRDAIVVVGAGHLAGPGSLVELLEKKGTKVVQQ